MRKKQAMTLIEIMVVVFFIGIIASLLAVNMKGTMEKGKVFKTRQAQNQIHDILLLEAAKTDKADLKKIAANPKKYLTDSGLVKNPDDFLKDGWGQPFEISVNKNNTDVSVVSKSLQKYEAEQKKASDDAASADQQDGPADVQDFT